MNKLIAVTFLVLASCSGPKLVTYENAEQPKARHGYIQFADFKSGERFNFNYPGARMDSVSNVVFGRTESGEFMTISTARIERWLIDTLLQKDSIVKVGLKSGEQYTFSPPARLYTRSLFIIGQVPNGTTVILPADRVVELNVLKNHKEVEAAQGVTTFFEVIGVLGLVVLRAMAEAEDSGN